MKKNILPLLLFLFLFSCSNKVEKLFNQAEILEQNKEYIEAIKILDKIIELNPDFLGAYINRGADYSALVQYKKAIKSFTQVIKIDSTNSLAYFNLANNLKRLNEIKKSIKYYDLALFHNKKGYKVLNIERKQGLYFVPFNEIYYERGLANYDLKQYNDAIQDFSNCTNSSTTEKEARYMLGATLLMLGKDNQACVELKRASLLGNEMAKKALKKYCE